jgi:putative copper resistance protein D
MDEGTRGGPLLNDALHVLAGCAWLGSLLALPGCLARLRDPAFCTEAKTALRRFSSAGHLAVALVIATGIVNTVLALQRWPTDFTSTYQMLLVAKIACVAGMTALALMSRYILVPGMLTQPDRAIIQIRYGTYAELALGAVRSRARRLLRHPRFVLMEEFLFAELPLLGEIILRSTS